MMKMNHVTENPPSKIARLSSYDAAAESGFGSLTLHDSCWNTTDGLINGERSPPIQLGLELRCGAAAAASGNSSSKPISSVLPAKPVTGGFTFLQIQELRQQTEIYKFIRAGLPVPHHLVFPIWKSVVCSLADGNKQSPFFPRIPGQFYLDYKGSMDPEPGRCRRTDGKKWRCSKEAIADQKYCERHMHRGKQRSRKQRDLLAAESSTSLSISLATNNSDSNSSRNINVAPRLVDFSASRMLAAFRQ